MKTPPERFRELLEGFGPEDVAEIEKRLGKPSASPREVAWRDDPDPFGQNWEWMQGSAPAARRGMQPGDRDEEGDPANIPATLPLSPGRDARHRRRPIFWVTGLAASIAVAALGTWAFVAPGRGPIREADVTAWVAQRLETGGGGIRIAAPGGDEEAEEPLIQGLDRPQDASAPSAPNVYAPLRIQEQLVVPELAPSTAPGQPTERPVRAVAEGVSPGALFYLEFTTASTPSIGSAVVVVSRGGTWRLLSDEVTVSPADRTGYFGPLKMDDNGASYFVILADRTSTPLLTTASRALAKVGGATPSPETLREAISAALQASGHAWYGIQRIEVRPETGREQRPQGMP